MEQQEVITNSEIEHILEMFKNAVQCVPRGVCLPDDAHVVVSRHYVVFTFSGGEVKLVRSGPFVEVRAGSYLLFNNSWDMFVLRNGKQVVYSPRIAIGGKTLDTNEFAKFVRKGFQVLLGVAANWV
jgi:hypothetical protein